MNYKFVTSGQHEDNALVVSETLRGNSLRPPMPSGFVCHFDSVSGDALEEWEGTSAEGKSNFEAYDLEQRDGPDPSDNTLGPAQIITPALNTELSETPPLEFNEDFDGYGADGWATFIEPGGVRFSLSTFDSLPDYPTIPRGWAQSKANASPVGGLLVEFEFSSLSGATIIPTDLGLYNTSEEDPVLEFAWHRTETLDEILTLDLGTQRVRPGDSATDYQVVRGDRIDILIRPDFTVEYYLNYRSGSQPVYVDSKRADPAALYKIAIVVDEITPTFPVPGGGAIAFYEQVTDVRWIRQGPEFLYTAGQQTLDHGSLPATVWARVRQRSFFTGGPPSAWVYGTFIR